MKEDLARKPPKNALPSHLDRWQKAKRDNPERWLKEWNDAKEWAKKELTKLAPER